MADVIPFLVYLLFPFESSVSIKPKENTFYTQIYLLLVLSKRWIRREMINTQRTLKKGRCSFHLSRSESESCNVSAFHGWRNTLFSVFIISLRIQRFDKTKRKYILHTNKENNIRNIVLVLMFQQLLASKHHRLRDSKFGRVEAWVWSQTKLRTRRSVRSYNRASKMKRFA